MVLKIEYALLFVFNAGLLAHANQQNIAFLYGGCTALALVQIAVAIDWVVRRNNADDRVLKEARDRLIAERTTLRTQQDNLFSDQRALEAERREFEQEKAKLTKVHAQAVRRKKIVDRVGLSFLTTGIRFVGYSENEAHLKHEPPRRTKVDLDDSDELDSVVVGFMWAVEEERV